MGLSDFDQDNDIRDMCYFRELHDAFGYSYGTCFCDSCLAMFEDRRLFTECLKVLANKQKVTRKLMLRFGNDWNAQHGFVKLLCLKQAKEIAK